MKRPLNSLRRSGRAACAGLGAALAALALGACGGGSGATTETAPAADSAADSTKTALSKDREKPLSGSTTATLVAQPPNTEGRLLASNCFQCHGTLGLGGFDKIRGSEASEVLEFLTKPAGSNIMAAHAQGYTPEQLQKIIAYLKQ